MIAAVMQQLFGPVLQGQNGETGETTGGDQGDEFAGLMAEGDDSPIAAEGAVKSAAEGAVSPTALPDLIAQAPAVIAVQFTMPSAEDMPMAAQSLPMPSGMAAQDRLSHSALAADPVAAFILPAAAASHSADNLPDMQATAAAPKGDLGDARPVLPHGTVVIDPILTAPNSLGADVADVPDLAEMARKAQPFAAPSQMQPMDAALEAAKMPRGDAEKSAPQIVPPPALATHFETGQAGRIALPNTALAGHVAAGIAPQIPDPVTAQPIALGQAEQALPLAQQAGGAMGDGPASRVQRQPIPAVANLAVAALQGIFHNADAQAQVAAAPSAQIGRGGDGGVLQAPIVQTMAAALGQGAAQTAPAQMVPAPFAAVQGEAADVLGMAADGDAPLSLVGIDARHGFAPPLGAGGAGAASPVFAGTMPTPAQLSAQLLPLAQSAQSGPVELVLSPAELGHLRFEIHHRGDQVQILLSAERPETLDLLRRNSEQLLSDFRNAGFAGASLAFGGWGAGQNTGASPQDLDRDGQAEGAGLAGQMPSGQPNQNPAFARAPTYLDPSRSLNLRL